MNDRPHLSRRALLRTSAVTPAVALIGLDAGRQTASAAEGAQITQLPQTVQSVQTALYTATNTTFGTASTGGSYADCAVTFVAPPSGRVLIHWSGAPRNIASTSSPVAYLSPEVRTGGTIGSGTVVLTANDTRSVRTNLTGSEGVRAGASHLLSGLTPGATYNARMLHRVTSQTGEFFHRTLIVAPAS